MAKSRSRYQTGTKPQILRRMAHFAIRDQEALIDAYTPAWGAPDAQAIEVIANGGRAGIRPVFPHNTERNKKSIRQCHLRIKTPMLGRLS